MTAAAQTAPTSSRRAEANRRNCMKSTGPSEAGKPHSKYNALKHGLRAKTVVLPGEDPAEFDARLEDWITAMRPRNPMESELVRRAVTLTWQLDRLGHTELAVLGKGSAPAREAQRRELNQLGVDLLRPPSGVPDDLYSGWSDGLELASPSPVPAGPTDPVAQVLRQVQATLAGGSGGISGMTTALVLRETTGAAWSGRWAPAPDPKVSRTSPPSASDPASFT